jgi:hypothetical protein
MLSIDEETECSSVEVGWGFSRLEKSTADGGGGM